MTRPRVLVTPWRRTLKTALDPECDLFTIAPDYTDAVRRAGGLPIVGAHLDADETTELLATVDAVLLSGGQDIDPDRYGHDNTSSYKPSPVSDEFDVGVVHAAIDRGLPILGVCRGAQVLNVALGGTLHQEIQQEGSVEHPTYAEMYPDLRGHRHDVDIVAGSRLAAIYEPGRLTVNSLHHQAIDEVGEGLVVTATTADGVVEAIEGDGNRDIVAVQWHPEMLYDEDGDAVFADLVDRARDRATMAT